MFIDGCLESRAGLDAELLVWNAVKGQFKGSRNILGFHQYPIFDKRNHWRREADILLIDCELGITVIEVKGIDINQIIKIQGSRWIYRKFYEQEGFPYQQAQRQIDMLVNRIHEDYPIISGKLSKRVFVALPYITKREWEDRGFHKLPNNPPIIFKDDLERNGVLAKVSTQYLHLSRKKITVNEWRKLKNFFSVQDESQISLADKEAKYSSLYLLRHQDDYERARLKINQNLKRGIRIYILGYFDVKESLNEEFYKDYIKYNQLVIAQQVSIKNSVDNILIIDGEGFNEDIEEIIKRDFPLFNVGQYKVVHTGKDENLIITAGAGTGKTHVMIDRILYLLLTDTCSLKDIIMITFTNDSTDEMRRRLSKKFIDLHCLIKNPRYLIFAEQLKQLEIMTIHRYLKGILMTLSHELGYGVNFKISSFKKEQGDIIDKLVDEYFENSEGEKTLFFRKFPKYYLFREKIHDFWMRMQTQGLTAEEMAQLDWGEPSTEMDKLLNKLFSHIFSKCEKELDAIKKQRNAIAVDDISRMLKSLINKDVWKQLPSNKFLFIDEFQDSDYSQIAVISKLCEVLDYRLFVVGDVKQSIYRFRGADAESFSALKGKCRENIFREVALNHNYRTHPNLLDKLSIIFNEWGESNRILYNKENDLLISGHEIFHGKGIIEYVDYSDTALEEIVERAYKEVVEDGSNSKIAVLVRENKDVQEIKNRLSLIKGIRFNQPTDLLFYRCEAVKDFKILLNALMFPEQPLFVLPVLQGPYFGAKVHAAQICRYEGDAVQLNNFIRKLQTGCRFYDYVEKLKVLPAMSVIQLIINKELILVRKQGDKQYCKNLGHLINLIQTNFTGNSVGEILGWLEVQIRVNRNEEVPTIGEQRQNLIEVMTVHKSKGLEFHTVILPKMDNNLFKQGKNIFFQQDQERDRISVGWCIETSESDKNEICNDYYGIFKGIDQAELEKDEVRLLYVALTRVKEKCIIINSQPKKRRVMSWASLMNLTGEGR